LAADPTNGLTRPGHDFGQSPILMKLRDGRRLLVIGQKSGVVHALDLSNGKISMQVPGPLRRGPSS